MMISTQISPPSEKILVFSFLFLLLCLLDTKWSQYRNLSKTIDHASHCSLHSAKLAEVKHSPRYTPDEVQVQRVDGSKDDLRKALFPLPQVGENIQNRNSDWMTELVACDLKIMMCCLNQERLGHPLPNSLSNSLNSAVASRIQKIL